MQSHTLKTKTYITICYSFISPIQTIRTFMLRFVFNNNEMILSIKKMISDLSKLNNVIAILKTQRIRTMVYLSCSKEYLIIQII